MAGPLLTNRLGLGLALAAAALLVHLLQWALLPFALAAVLAFLTDPLVEVLSRRAKAPRWICALLVFIGVFLVLGILLGVSLAEAAAAGLHLAERGPGPLKGVLTKVLGPGGITLFGTTLTPDGITGALASGIAGLLTPKGALVVARPLLAILVGVVLLVFATLYAMLTGRGLLKGALSLLPPAARRRADALAPEILKILRRYFFGILVIVVVTSLAAFAGYGLVFHVRRPLVLALALGFLETVPVIGPLISAVLVLLAALQLHSLAILLLMIGYALVLRLLIDDVVAPVVLGRSVAVNPLVVMLAYVVGAALFGVIGLLFAVPTLAVVRLLLKRAPPTGPSDEDLRERIGPASA